MLIWSTIIFWDVTGFKIVLSVSLLIAMFAQYFANWYHPVSNQHIQLCAVELVDRHLSFFFSEAYDMTVSIMYCIYYVCIVFSGAYDMTVSIMYCIVLCMYCFQ